jgi:Nucleotidyl transferase AbiEii toxin, Type IV TA system
LHVDVNFGDPIWPAPAQSVLPLLLGGTLTLRGYPDHMVLAEKIVTAIDRGDQNTRWRDFVDIAALAATRRIRYDDLRAAIETVADYRQVRLQPLAPLLGAMPDIAQGKWASWRRKQRLDATTPERFGDLLGAVFAFAEPVLDGSAEGRIWHAATKSWGAADMGS